MPSYAVESDDCESLRLLINKMIDDRQYDKAAKFLSEREETDISEGYRMLAAFIGAYYELKNKDELKEKYFIKGCELGDYKSCREHTYTLVKNGKFKEAEATLLEIANKHFDPRAASYLVSLYHNRKWDGFNEEKAKYWRNKTNDFVKKQSNKSLKQTGANNATPG